MNESYQPSPIKPKRKRSSALELRALDGALRELIENAGPPCTVRQVYYMAVGNDLGPKNQKFYEKIQRRLAGLREAGELPWPWIADNTRWVRQAAVKPNLMDALADFQESYRRDYWRSQPNRLELWVESDSIASFLNNIVVRYGIPMFVTRGQSSKSYVHGAAQSAQELGKPVKILYCGDWDPTGLAVDRSVEERYRRYGSGVDLSLERIAVTPAQIAQMGLHGGPPNKRDSNYSRFELACDDAGVEPVAVETEAMPPTQLRQIVTDAILDEIDVDSWRAQEAYEAQEHLQIESFMNKIVGAS